MINGTLGRCTVRKKFFFYIIYPVSWMECSGDPQNWSVRSKNPTSIIQKRKNTRYLILSSSFSLQFEYKIKTDKSYQFCTSLRSQVQSFADLNELSIINHLLMNSLDPLQSPSGFPLSFPRPTRISRLFFD